MRSFRHQINEKELELRCVPQLFLELLLGRAAGQLLYWTRCVSAIGRVAGQLLASFFF